MTAEPQREKVERRGRELRMLSQPGLALPFVGESPAIRRLRELLERAADLDAPVLLCGEAGSGRTRAARWLHEASPRRTLELRVLRGGPPPESELAAIGTLFVPEIFSLPGATLDAWREHLARRTRGPRLVASARPLLVAPPGQEALFTALQRLVMRVPSLGERRPDLALLVADLGAEVAHELGRPPCRLAAGALAELASALWLASVAELRRTLERLAVLADEGELSRDDVRAALAEQRPSVALLREHAREEERRALLRALAEAGGNMTRAAAQLGRSRAAVYRLVAKHGVLLKR
jgi:DNA-binding NtrC family response regulator